jgi:hypothetical protein
MQKQKKTDRKLKNGLNMNDIVKSMIELNGIATVNDIQEIVKRLDKIESMMSALLGKRPKTKKETGRKVTTTGLVLDVLKKSKKGIDVETIQTKTGIDKIQIRNAIFLLTKNGKIRRKSRGLYEAVKEQLRPVQKVKQTGSQQNSTEAPMPVEE